MDPRKIFLCPAGKHILRDGPQRPWRKDSVCDQCLEEQWVEEMENKYCKGQVKKEEKKDGT